MDSCAHENGVVDDDDDDDDDDARDDEDGDEDEDDATRRTRDAPGDDESERTRDVEDMPSPRASRARLAKSRASSLASVARADGRPRPDGDGGVNINKGLTCLNTGTLCFGRRARCDARASARRGALRDAREGGGE